MAESAVIALAMRICSGVSARGRPMATPRRKPGPPKTPRETHASERLWKVSPPWKPAAKPAPYHRGLEAFGFHTSRNPDGGFTYKPLTRGVGPFYSIGVGSFYVVKATG